MKKLFKKLLPVVAMVTITLGSLSACTPHEARMNSLAQMRLNGVPEQTVKFFDCVGYRESRWQAGAVGGPNRNGTYDVGLFQINQIHARQFKAVTGKDYWPHAKDPGLNTQYAIWLWRTAGKSPWRGHSCR